MNLFVARPNLKSLQLPDKDAVMILLLQVEGVAETTAPAAAKALSHTALALSLLLDGYTIFTTAREIHRGVGSDFGQQLRHLAVELENQAKQLNDIRRTLTEQRATVLSRIIITADENE